VLIKLLSCLHELLTKVSEMRNRVADRGKPQSEKDLEYFQRMQAFFGDLGEFRNLGSSDFPMGNLSRIQVKTATVEIDGDLEMVTVPESTGTFLYGCNL
jgi:hypothetical protein